jgi:hypothetical protein
VRVRGVYTQVTGRVLWARMVMATADGIHHVVPLAGDGPPDLAVVEALARCQLITRRVGGRMWLEEVSPGLAELLDLTGLRGELTGRADPEPYSGR